MPQLTANLVDLHRREIYPSRVYLEAGRIVRIERLENAVAGYLLPGFVDAHVHIESSMLTPVEFARLAVVHGTVATVSDPHEIANVLGVEGVEYMIANGNLSPFKFNFGVPSCVPATVFETAGASINAKAVSALLQRPEIKYLAEVMNYPGVINGDPELLAMLASAKKAGKPIDGHAPGLRGTAAEQYFATGISTDHECFSYEEAREKLLLGVKILIREGSAAKNFAALIPLLAEFPQQIMFCSDDKHPDDLIQGHINDLVARSLGAGHDLFDTLRAACVHPVEHYGLDVGLLRVGDPADFILSPDLQYFKNLNTYIDGELVAKNGGTLLPYQSSPVVNHFAASKKQPDDFKIKNTAEEIQIIKALDGELITESFFAAATIRNGEIVPDEARDILKIAVVNRYTDATPALGFIHNFGIKNGAIASCIAHDSHNIIAVGTSDALICRAVNLLIEHRGGICAVGPDDEQILPLPVAGIMTGADGFEVAKQYAKIDHFAKAELKSTLRAPFMTLSFMALLVIPDLKMSDLGLFSGKAFSFVDLLR